MSEHNSACSYKQSAAGQLTLVPAGERGLLLCSVWSGAEVAISMHRIVCTVLWVVHMHFAIAQMQA